MARVVREPYGILRGKIEEFMIGNWWWKRPAVSDETGDAGV